MAHASNSFIPYSQLKIPSYADIITIFMKQRPRPHRLRLFGNRVFRRIFAPDREEIMEVLKEFDEELHNLYSLPSINR
jgi:hypothetical protein